MHAATAGVSSGPPHWCPHGRRALSNVEATTHVSPLHRLNIAAISETRQDRAWHDRRNGRTSRVRALYPAAVLNDHLLYGQERHRHALSIYAHRPQCGNSLL